MKKECAEQESTSPNPDEYRLDEEERKEEEIKSDHFPLLQIHATEARFVYRNTYIVNSSGNVVCFYAYLESALHIRNKNNIDRHKLSLHDVDKYLCENNYFGLEILECQGEK